MARNIAVGYPPVRVENVLLVVLIQQDDAFRAEDLHARALPEGRILLRKRVVHAKAHHCSIGKGEDGPCHIVRVVSSGLEHPLLTAGHYLHWRMAFKEPTDEIDVVRQNVQHRRGVKGPFEDLEGLCPRVVDPDRARERSISETARKRTAGCVAAMLARRVPIRPEPMMAIPRSFRLIPFSPCCANIVPPPFHLSRALQNYEIQKLICPLPTPFPTRPSSASSPCTHSTPAAGWTRQSASW